MKPPSDQELDAARRLVDQQAVRRRFGIAYVDPDAERQHLLKVSRAKALIDRAG